MPGNWLWYTLPFVSVPGLQGLVAGPAYRHTASPRASGAWLQGEDMLTRYRTVLAVAAHPDDLEYFVGGTLARMAGQGCRVVAVLATRGERGGRGPNLPERRCLEQEVASRRMGYAALHVLDRPDGGLQADDPDLLSQLGDLIRTEQPEALFTFDPVKPFPVYLHPDHFAVAEAVLKVWTGPIVLFHTRAPNTVVDITRHFHDKVAALVVHRSQMPHRGTMPLVRWHLRNVSSCRGPDRRRRLIEVFRWLQTTAAVGEPIPRKFRFRRHA